MEPMQTRYARQTVLKEIGPAGQQMLAGATAVVVGLGALGSNSANLLARAGVGTLRLVDRDIVDWTNLQRQIPVRGRRRRPIAAKGRSGGAVSEAGQL